MQRLNFRDVHAITIGFGCGQRVRLMWSRHRVTIDRPAKPLQFSVITLGVADRIATTIHALNPLPRPPPIDLDLQTERVIREKLLEPSTEEVRLHLQLEKLLLGSGKAIQRVAVITSLSLYLLSRMRLLFASRSSPRQSGAPAARTASTCSRRTRSTGGTRSSRSTSSPAISPSGRPLPHGSCQLRFGDDFGLMVFKRELRRLLPSGVDSWRRNFGFHADAGGGAADEGEEGADADADAADDEDDEAEELGDDDHQGDD